MLFSATNELAFHVPNPEAAEDFYTKVLGCTVVDRNPDFISLTNGELRLYLVRDPARTHLGAVPSFEVHDRAAALVELQAVGCTLVPIGPHAPDEHYVRDPNGIVFDVVERRELA
jgi:catechol 2,3-dioxygenase-like lactoylglutathione lyase family enzyme